MALGPPAPAISAFLVVVFARGVLSTLTSASPIDGKNSFSLIRRDSGSSPIKRNWTSVRKKFEYYLNASQSRSEHFYETIQRKLNQSSGDPYRTSGFSQNINVINGVTAFGEYILLMYISEKRFKQYVVYDTGSDLIWIQCKPCKPCFKQLSPTYDMSKSQTSRILPCSKCKLDSLSNAQCLKKRCVFDYFYADQSSLSGLLATERFNFGSARNYNFLFGCATSSEKFGDFPDGLAGFSLGSTSLPNQMAKVSGRNAFASCLVRNGLDKENKLVVGPKAVSYSGVSYTPIVNPFGVGRPDFYFVEVLKVTVGSTVLKISRSAFNNAHRTIIDSGTTFTLLNKQVLNPILNEVKRIGEKKFKVVKNSRFPLCFEWTQTNQLQYNIYFPPITFTFKSDVDVKILGYNYMDYVGDGQVCTMFIPISLGSNLLGNYFQQNLLVVHDVAKMRVGFKPMDCATGKAR